VDTLNHHFENVSIVNTQLKAPVYFNNLNNSLNRHQLAGLHLENTDLYVFSAFNLNLLNLNAFKSNIYTFARAYPNSFDGKSFIDTKSIFSATSCNSSSDNIISLDDENDSFTTKFTDIHFPIDCTLKFRVKNSSNSKLRFTLTPYLQDSTFNFHSIEIYQSNKLIFSDSKQREHFYLVNFLNDSTNINQQQIELLLRFYSSNVPIFKFKFEPISNETSHQLDQFILGDSYFENSQLTVDSHSVRIETSVFNQIKSFQMNLYQSSLMLVNTQIRNSECLYFFVNYGKSIEIRNTHFFNNRINVFKVKPYDVWTADDFKSYFILDENNFDQNRPCANFDQNFLFGFQALSNVSIKSNTFNNSLQNTNNVITYELVLQLFDQRLVDSYDLSQNHFCVNDTLILVHSYFSGLYLNFKLDKVFSTKNVDFFGSLFQHENTVILKNKSTPYYFNSGLKIGFTQTLIVEPGVVIKVLRDAFIMVHGSLVLNGTERDPIVLSDNRNEYFAFDLNYPVPFISWFESRASNENLALIYFRMSSNDTGSTLTNVIFKYLARTHIFISRFMPKLEHVNITETSSYFSQSLIAISQPDDAKIELKHLNVIASNAARNIFIDNSNPVDLAVSNLLDFTIKLLPTFAFDASFLNDIVCNLGPSHSFYI
jgi:hypothetical protein